MLAFSSGAEAQAPAASNANQLWPWAVYYSDKAPLEAFKPFKLLVLDSQYHPPLAPLQAQNKVLLGYISLGEVEQHRAWFGKAKEAGLLLKENKNWPGSYFVDMRNKVWADIVLNDVLPQLQKKGFDGFFYDTLDNPAFLEDSDPKLYAGIKQATINLLAEIRKRYPAMKLMMNRGYGLLPGAAPHIDMLLAESMYADYNFDTKTYRKVPEADYTNQLKLLHSTKKANARMGIYTLDYWKPEDKAKVDSIYALQWQSGFSPYVSTVELNAVFQPPLGK
jgi:uncharacterized protein (TIGR01370 family)